MKKQYERPVIKCDMFITENIFTLSGGAELADKALEAAGYASRKTVDIIKEIKLTM
ncbi:MAG: hypothetical protein Q4G33_14070 [bacterium]|nr:hypothetical protein [bacterium]